jgi:D-threo-aldose 1-dehydrogenase
MSVNPEEKRPFGRTGLDLTLAGFGGTGIGNIFSAISTADAWETMEAAWSAGIRFFDTAPRYGHGLSERRLGDFLRTKPRESYVLSTKVGRLLTPLRGRTMTDYGFADPLPFEQEYDYSYDGVMRSHEASLHRLGLDRVDILFIHDIGRYMHGADNDRHFPIAMDGGLRALEELKRAGDIRGYGIGVNEVEVCLAALEYGDFDGFLLAGRYTLLERHKAEPLLDACLQRGASIVIGGVFNSGILVTGPKPDSRFDYAPAPPDVIAEVTRLDSLAKAHNVRLPAAALQFPPRHPAISTVLLGAPRRDMLQTNLTDMQAPIPQEFWDELPAT